MKKNYKKLSKKTKRILRNAARLVSIMTIASVIVFTIIKLLFLFTTFTFILGIVIGIAIAIFSFIKAVEFEEECKQKNRKKA